MTKDQISKLGAANAHAEEHTGAPKIRVSTEESDEVADDVEAPRGNTAAGKFVNLVDILPPLPAKGQFDVKTIKQSLYFFS